MFAPRTVAVLLGGGIGAGKSALGDALRRRGAFVIDADLVGHGVLEAGGEAYRAVAERWPGVVRGGVIDRRRLGEIVFADAAQLAELEAVTHPAIGRRIAELIDESEAEAVVVEVPVLGDLLGQGWKRVVVTAPVEVRRSRLMGRDLTDDQVRRRMESQPTDAEWREAADYEVDNSGNLEDLEEAADALLQWLGVSI